MAGVTQGRRGSAGRDAKQGCCPWGGSVGGMPRKCPVRPVDVLCSSDRTCHRAGKPSFAAWQAVGKLLGKPRSIEWPRTEKRHVSERGEMTRQIAGREGEPIGIHVREAVEVTDLVQEMTLMVARLSRETREMREEVARLRSRKMAAAPSAPRLRGGAPDVPR